MSTTQAKSFAKLSKVALIAVAVTLSVISVPTPSHALGTASQRAACLPDVFRLCGSAIPDTGRIIVCMKANRANLSPPCKSLFDHAAQSAQNDQ